MSLLDVFKRTLISLNEATLNDDHWPAASALIDEACRVKGNQLVVGSGSGSDAEVFFARNYHRGQRREDFERDYFLNYHAHDERLPRLRQLPDGKLAPVTELYSEQELKTSPTYNEALARSHSQNSLNVRMDGPGGSRVVWGIADPVQKGGWWSDQIEMIERLLPHIRHHVRVRHALAGGKGVGASVAGLLDSTRIGVIHLDRRGRIIAANDVARGILRQGDGLWDEDGLLRARLPADDARLEKLLGRALPTLFGEAPSGGSLMVGRPPDLPSLAVHLSPVAALVLVVDAVSRSKIDPALVGEVLDLTPAQSQVAAMLAEGVSVRDIANRTGRQANTVRQLLKQVCDRRGLSGRTDLVRQVLSLADLPGPGG